MDRRLLKRTYEPRSLLKSYGRSTAHLPRVFVNIQIGPGVEALYFVDSWFQFPIPEDR